MIKRIYLQIILVFLAITLVSLISLQNTFNFYFYSDDYAVLYHHINNLTYYPPFYTYVPKFYGWIYDLYGLNPKPYFTFSVFAHVLAAFSLYFYTYRITKQKIIALFSALIFSTGYIGIESFTQMNTATVDSLNVFFTMLALIFQINYFEKKKIKNYLIMLLIFFLCLVVFPFRAFQMVIFLLLADLILNLDLISNFKIRNYATDFIKRNLPILIIYFLLGVGAYGNNIFEMFLKNFVTENRSLFFSVFGNMILPNKINPDYPKDFIGIIFTISVIILGIVIKKNKNLSKSIFLSLLFSYAGFVGFFLLLPSFDANFEVNRYLSLSFAGFSVLISTLVYSLVFKFSEQKKVMLYIIILIPYIVLLANLSFFHQKKFVDERSNYAKKIFVDLVKLTPQLDSKSKSIFYFRLNPEEKSSIWFESAVLVAYMPSKTSLAVHFNKKIDDIDLIMDKNSKLLIPSNLNGDMYFYKYDYNGLHNLKVGE